MHLGGRDMATLTPPAAPQTPPPQPIGSSPVTDTVQAGLQSISTSLQRRGYLTTEWWTTIVGAGLTVVLSFLHPGGSAAAQTASILAPAVIAMVYTVSRTAHKSALADVLQAAVPDAANNPTA